MKQCKIQVLNLFPYKNYEYYTRDDFIYNAVRHDNEEGCEPLYYLVDISQNRRFYNLYDLILLPKQIKEL